MSSSSAASDAKKPRSSARRRDEGAGAGRRSSHRAPLLLPRHRGCHFRRAGSVPPRRLKRLIFISGPHVLRCLARAHSCKLARANALRVLSCYLLCMYSRANWLRDKASDFTRRTLRNAFGTKPPPQQRVPKRSLINQQVPSCTNGQSCVASQNYFVRLTQSPNETIELPQRKLVIWELPEIEDTPFWLVLKKPAGKPVVYAKFTPTGSEVPLAALGPQAPRCTRSSPRSG